MHSSGLDLAIALPQNRTPPQITERGLFVERVESRQAGGNLLVLNPQPPD